MTLLRQIQDAALDSTVDLSDLLRKCKVLAARLKHPELAQWVDRELNGYPTSDTVPPYRRIKVGSLGHFSGPFGTAMHNVPIPASNIEKKFRHFVTDQVFMDPISALAEITKGSPGVLQGKWPGDLIKYAQRYCPIYEDMSLIDAWRVIPGASVKGILDTVRTRILDFVLAVEAEEPDAGDVAPGQSPKLRAEAVTNIFNTTINGGAANIGTSGNAQIQTGKISFSPAIPERKRKQLEKLINKLREHAEATASPEQEEAQHALARVEEQLAAPEPRLTRIKSYLDLYATLVTVAAPTVEALQKLLAMILPQ